MTSRQLQQAVGVTRDGIIGPATLAAVAACEPAGLCHRLHDTAGSYYASLGEPQFVRGWDRRNDDRLTLALGWAANPTA